MAPIIRIKELVKEHHFFLLVKIQITTKNKLLTILQPSKYRRIKMHQERALQQKV